MGSVKLGNVMVIMPIACMAISVSYGQSAGKEGSWLDKPLANWNRHGAAIPKAPTPKPEGKPATISNNCGRQVRQPESAADRAVVSAGWTLFGPVQSYSGTSVMMAMSDVDGMCRPLGYQIFVFANGKFAGTLSPTPMNSRADGAMGTIRLAGPANLSAEFVRYTDADALCCPSRTGAVDYRIDRSGKGGVVVPTGVIPLSGSTPAGSSGASPGQTGSDASFENTYWKLMELNGKPVAVADNQREPHFRLDPKEKRLQGSGGCNRIGGSYEVNGEQLRFSKMFATRMACPSGMETEQEFVKALEATAGFKLSGEKLELYGDGKLLARLESRYLK